MNTPSNEISNTCQYCGLPAQTKYVEFYENVGALVIRYHRSVKARLCKHCIDTFFWNYTGKTMLLGWWGIISFIITPFILLNNIFRFVSSIGMEKPPIRISQSPSPFWAFSAIAGIIFIAYLIYSIAEVLLTSSSTSYSQVQTCTMRLLGYDTYVVLNGNGAAVLCDDTIRNNSSTFQRSYYSPQSPIICRETIDNVEFVVIDTSTSGLGGNLACRSLYEAIQK